MDTPKGPISFFIDTRRLPEKGFPVAIEPSPAELSALAAAHGLASVLSFSADLLVRNWKKSGVIVTGVVRARIVQECVVTLEPVETSIEEQVEASFVPEGSPLARPDIAEGEMFLAADGPDAPEIFDGARLDAGGVAEEFFALAIDLYPRKAGAEIPAAGHGEASTSPFAKLDERLRKT